MSNEQILTEITDAENKLNEIRRNIRALADNIAKGTALRPSAQLDAVAHELFSHVQLSLTSLRGTFRTRVDLDRFLEIKTDSDGPSSNVEQKRCYEQLVGRAINTKI